MNEKSVTDIASGYGLTIETVRDESRDDVLKVFKGLNQIFIGSDKDVRDFLADYERNRPGPMDLSMYGYRE